VSEGVGIHPITVATCFLGTKFVPNFFPDWPTGFPSKTILRPELCFVWRVS
jgi:hypothetical protein